MSNSSAVGSSASSVCDSSAVTAFVSEQLLSGTVSSVSNSSVVNPSASSVCNSSAVTVSSVTWDAWASSGSLGLRKVCEGAKVRRGEGAKMRRCEGAKVQLLSGDGFVSEQLHSGKLLSLVSV